MQGWESKIVGEIPPWTSLSAARGGALSNAAPPLEIKRVDADVSMRSFTLALPHPHGDGDGVQSIAPVHQFRLSTTENATLLWCPLPNHLSKPIFPEHAQYHQIRSFTGGLINQPRRTVCYGHSYAYSGQLHPVERETPPEITAWYQFLNELFGVELNMCLGEGAYGTSPHALRRPCLISHYFSANGYFHGKHSISEHSDDERQMGQLNEVYCVSIGAPRRAIFRRKQPGSARVVLDLLLPEGIYVMMGDSFQREFTHEFPKVGETAFNKYFVHAIPENVQGVSAPLTTMDKADWLCAHQDEVREKLREIHPKCVADFDAWSLERYSFTFRQFDTNVTGTSVREEPPQKKRSIHGVDRTALDSANSGP